MSLLLLDVPLLEDDVEDEALDERSLPPSFAAAFEDGGLFWFVLLLFELSRAALRLGGGGGAGVLLLAACGGGLLFAGVLSSWELLSTSDEKIGALEACAFELAALAGGGVNDAATELSDDTPTTGRPRTMNSVVYPARTGPTLFRLNKHYNSIV